MIPRYTRPEMARIWAPETRFRIWFEIEAHAASAMAELGVIPKEAAKAIWEKGSKAAFDVARIDAIEREVKHDVIAFLTHLAEHVGPEARFVHQGMTSSDVLDTCLQRAAGARRRPAARRPRRAAGRAEDARARAQAHAHHRPQPRHPRRAHHLRPEARLRLCRVRPRQGAPGRARAPRSPPAPSPARSAPSPTSTRASRPMSPRSWASRPSRSRPRSSRATGTPCISPRWP